MTNTQVRDAKAVRAIEQVEAFGKALKAFVIKTYSDEELRRMRYSSWGRKNLSVSRSGSNTDMH